MDKHDPEKKIGFYVDDWGTLYDAPEEGDTAQKNPGFLFQQNSLRDAVLAAVNLNIFHQYADRIKMSVIAQMVNVLQAMILTDKEKMLLTPTYHVFKMYIPFQGAKSIPVTISNNNQYGFENDNIPAVSASAAVTAKGEVYLALANTDPKLMQSLQIKTLQNRTDTLVSARGTLLTADTMDAHNTFANPNHLTPVPFSTKVDKGVLTIKLPAKSVMVVKLK